MTIRGINIKSQIISTLRDKIKATRGTILKIKGMTRWNSSAASMRAKYKFHRVKLRKGFQFWKLKSL